MKIESAAFANGAKIPERNSAYGDNRSPALHWSDVPAATKSFALIVDDPDAPGAEPFVHWLVYNIPPTIDELPEGLPGSGELATAGGARQGHTSAGSVGYFGPRPPKTHPAHHYHFQLFALDTMLPLEPGADRRHLAQAMKGHTLAKAETVGTYAAPRN